MCSAPSPLPVLQEAPVQWSSQCLCLLSPPYPYPTGIAKGQLKRLNPRPVASCCVLPWRTTWWREQLRDEGLVLTAILAWAVMSKKSVSFSKIREEWSFFLPFWHFDEDKLDHVSLKHCHGTHLSLKHKLVWCAYLGKPCCPAGPAVWVQLSIDTAVKPALSGSKVDPVGQGLSTAQHRCILCLKPLVWIKWSEALNFGLSYPRHHPHYHIFAAAGSLERQITSITQEVQS